MPELPHSEPDLAAHVRVISELARMGRAPNQCPECHSFRMDGEPSVLHGPGCTHADDEVGLIEKALAKGRECFGEDAELRVEFASDVIESSRLDEGQWYCSVKIHRRG